MSEIAPLELEEDLAATVLRQCLDSFPHIRLQVTGECMRPILRHGDVVRIVSTANQAPRLGDIVLVKSAAGLRLHRLVWGPPFAATGGQWRTKGDHSSLWDAPVAPEDVLGVVVEVEGPCFGWRAAMRQASTALASLGRSVLTSAREYLPGWGRA
jgi:hypothetical protein